MSGLLRAKMNFVGAAAEVAPERRQGVGLRSVAAGADAIIPAMDQKAQSRDAGANSPLMVNSVQKAFRVLTAFNRAEPRLTLTQIADKLDVDKSTAQRFTHTLLVMGYLDKDPVAKTFGVTVKLVDLAHLYLSTNPLIAAAMPYLIHLNGETGETVNLAVLDGPDTVFLSRMVGSNLLSTGVIIGTRLPAFATATGQAILSTWTEVDIRRLLEISDLRAFTPKTLTEPAKIVERLRLAKAKGYVMSVGDYFASDISIGAPIVSRSGAVLGAISLSVTNDRFTAKEAETQFARLVATTAQSIQP